MKVRALWLVTTLYAWQAIICLLRAQYAESVIMFGYIVANIGLIVLVVK